MQTTIIIEQMASKPGFWRVVEVGPTGFVVLADGLSHNRAVLRADACRTAYP